MPAESGVQPLSQGTEERPQFCAHCLTNGAGLPPVFLGGEECAHVCWVFAHWLTGQGRGPAPRATLHTSVLVLVLVRRWGPRDLGRTHPGLGVQSQPANTCLFTHMCAQARQLCLLRPVSRGLHTVIFPLLSTIMELPVLLERLPNTLIGTPAMIKKKFQMRATML